MMNPKVPGRKEWALSHGFILASLISPSIEPALVLGRYIGGIVGLIIAGTWCFASGLCLTFIPACKNLS